MGGFIHRFYVDLWIPVWPNLAASVICFGVAYWRGKVHLMRHHEALKEHMTQEIKAMQTGTEGEPSDSLPG